MAFAIKYEEDISMEDNMRTIGQVSENPETTSDISVLPIVADEKTIGKVCPFCKTKIKDGDEVIVCPACGIPHHKGCWEENKGCTTFGCKEQHYEAQGTNPTDVCPNCGASLGDGQMFCPKCGTPKGGVKSNVCGKCGTELQEGQEFCPKCGQKAGLIVDTNVNSAISQFNAGVNKTNDAKKKKPLKIVLAAIIALAVIVAGVLIAPKIFVSVDDLCAQGNYEKAYDKADSDSKLEVKAESIAAAQSSISADNLKDPSSFVLRDAYYKEGTNDDGETTGQLVLYVSGSNSYGASVSSYWLYTWSNDENEWSYFASVSDLSDEEYSEYDDSDEELEKLLNNVARSSIKSTMSDGLKLSKESIKRINSMFEDDTLNSVKPIGMK
jgi:Oxygen-sensitive ribonucleoside-triphosphate reductase